MPELPAAVLPSGPRGWLRRAVCADPAHDPEWWWPVSTEPGPGTPGWADTARALQLCAACPVIVDCRDDFYAVELRGDPGGVRFATLPGGRDNPKSVRRRQARADRRAADQSEAAA